MITQINRQTGIRISALSCLIRDHGRHIESYKGDLCHDGAMLALNNLPCLVVLHRCGSHLTFDRRGADALMRSYGPTPDCLWFVGRPGEDSYTFTPATVEEALAALPALTDNQYQFADFLP